MKSGVRAGTAILLLAWLPCVALHAAPVEDLRPGQRPAAGSDEDELWYAMDRTERELQQSPRLLRDAALNRYVAGVACRVAGDHCGDMRVYVMQQPWFNATMAPNGMMVVWTGALLRMRNEAELAGVLGHEFAHFRERHSLQQWRKVKSTSAFMGTFSIMTLGGGVGLLGVAGNLAGSATLAGFSRDKERQADAEGFARVTALGYDPQAGVALWERMSREEAARDYGKPTPVFASHPDTAERVADVRAAAQAVAQPGHERGEERHLEAIRPHLQSWLDDELSRRMYATSLVVIGELESRAPALGPGLLGFYLAEAHRRRRGPGDSERAAALYAQAAARPDAPAAAFREHGLALRMQGQAAAAAQALRRYLELAPQAEDRAFIDQYVAELETPP